MVDGGDGHLPQFVEEFLDDAARIPEAIVAVPEHLFGQIRLIPVRALQHEEHGIQGVDVEIFEDAPAFLVVIERVGEQDELTVHGAAVEKAAHEFVAAADQGIVKALLVLLEQGFDALAAAGVVGEDVGRKIFAGVPLQVRESEFPGLVGVPLGNGDLAFLSHRIDLNTVASAGVVELVGEFGLLVEIEVAEDGDDGFDQIRFAGAVLTNDGVAFDFAWRAVGVGERVSKSNLEIPQISEVLNF
jgi:hypothetical protein